MDFTQHNKINSKTSRNVPKRQNDVQPDQFPGTMHSKFPPQMTQMGNMNKSYIPDALGQQNFSCNEAAQYQPHHDSQAQRFVSDDLDLESNLEYYQCGPTAASANHQKNPFKQVIDSMRKYSSCKATSTKIHALANHRTFICAHDENAESYEQQFDDDSHHKSFRSHTKIIAIPNGVKIITEILKDDNEELQESENCLEANSKAKNSDWLNKQIEVTVDEDDVDD
jgi:hypothetical protein